MYYLRRETHEYTIPEIKKTDGTTIPERKTTAEDMALYRATDCGWRGRDYYPVPHNKGVKLYMCKSIKHILSERKALFDYCGELFDIYDENGKVEIQPAEHDNMTVTLSARCHGH